MTPEQYDHICVYLGLLVMLNVFQVLLWLARFLSDMRDDIKQPKDKEDDK